VERSAAQIKDIMSRDYASVIKRRLDDVYKNVNSSPTGPQRERADKDTKSTFIVSAFIHFLERVFTLQIQILLNDLDVSSSHMDRLVKDLSSASLISQNFLESEVFKVRALISTLLDLVPQFQRVLRVSILT
jgi:conserved oligomeric Golgi complex subunit 4